MHYSVMDPQNRNYIIAAKENQIAVNINNKAITRITALTTESLFLMLKYNLLAYLCQKSYS